MKTIVRMENVSKTYVTGDTKVNAISDVSFTVNEGEFVVILGESGAGKSTTLNLLGGMDTVTSGNIFIEDCNISEMTKRQLTKYRATDVGFIFQFYNLIPSLTVYENVRIVNEVCENNLDAKTILESVGLSDRLNLFPNQISGGEQQRVSIARAVCKNPKILLCDEPTGALDSQTGVKVLRLLQEMSDKYNKSVVVVTHNAKIAEIADKVIKFKDGRISYINASNSKKDLSEIEW